MNLHTSSKIYVFPGYPDKNEIIANQKIEDFYAIASFNLLGLQSYYETDREWLKKVIEHLNSQNPSIETELFTLLFNQTIYSKDELIHEYTILHQLATDDLRFTYTGIINGNRIDSYCIPFANLSIKSYLKLLIAKEYVQLGNVLKALELKGALLEAESFNSQQKLQFEGYWKRFIQ